MRDFEWTVDPHMSFRYQHFMQVIGATETLKLRLSHVQRLASSMKHTAVSLIGVAEVHTPPLASASDSAALRHQPKQPSFIIQL